MELSRTFPSFRKNKQTHIERFLNNIGMIIRRANMERTLFEKNDKIRTAFLLSGTWSKSGTCRGVEGGPWCMLPPPLHGGGGSLNITSGDLLKKNLGFLILETFKAFHNLFLKSFCKFLLSFLQSSQTCKAV